MATDAKILAEIRYLLHERDQFGLRTDQELVARIADLFYGCDDDDQDENAHIVAIPSVVYGCEACGDRFHGIPTVDPDICPSCAHALDVAWEPAKRGES
jgi:rubrerythrin